MAKEHAQSTETKWQRVSYSLYTWDESKIGTVLEGKIVEINPFDAAAGSQFDTVCNRYLIELSNGHRVSTVLGSATDAQIASYATVGKMIHIEYLGKNKTSKGQQVNSFDVMVG